MERVLALVERVSESVGGNFPPVGRNSEELGEKSPSAGRNWGAVGLFGE